LYRIDIPVIFQTATYDSQLLQVPGRVKADRDTFGPRLRFERERRGIALKNIAASTKIKESLFVELERSDFSNWPQGIFRRAHLCAYASAIGLQPQPVLADYLRLFPDDPPVNGAGDLEADGTPGAPQPKPAVQAGRVTPRLTERAWVVLFDVAMVCGISTILAGMARVSVWPALGLVGLGYSALGSACFAQSIGMCVQRRIHAMVQARNRPQPISKTPLREVQPPVQPPAPRPAEPSVPRVNTSRQDEVERHRASA
jgi:hypothetical protein